jgi:RNA polymerase sigma-70 factor (ECF subfamily)
VGELRRGLVRTVASAIIGPGLLVYAYVTDDVAAMVRARRATEGPTEAETRLLGLFESHHRRLYLLARRLTASPSEAEDVVQDTFLRAARTSTPVPQDFSGAEAWLVRILVNVCRDRWRVLQGRRRLEARYETPRWTPAAGNPEAALIAQTTIWNALNQLAPRRRAVVVLHEIEGIDISGISRLLGISAVTVRWHVGRGRLELARLIERQEESPR